MMVLQVYLIAFFISYLGSIPPGTINVSTMQYAMQQHLRTAFYFALAASLTEFFYAGATVRFQLFLSEKQEFSQYFQAISGVAMIVLGLINFFAKRTKVQLRPNNSKARSGFKKGVILGIANPLTIPFWLAITAYLQSNNLISLEGSFFWYYLIGIATGTFALLLTVIQLGKRFQQIAENHLIVNQLPGLLFFFMGLWNLGALLF